MRVHIVVFDGMDDLDVVGPFAVLGMAGRAGLGVSVRLTAPGDPPHATTRGGLPLHPEPWAPRDADVLLVPGGGYGQGDGAGVRAEIAEGRVPAALADAVRPDLVLASVCTGALLLAAAGVVTGRPCTTHHRAVGDLVEAGGVHVDARVVDDGDLVTAGGVTSGLDLALWLVERFRGPDAAERVQSALEYERREPLWLRAGEVAAR
ncbi:DJ-1/PfpI family protein [Lentzea fradiae]|uniref:DJ-1/PfpI family protein n=1 Tax=Lentzea fradiae TaxID=200378 RepID=A0A1G7L0D5_9PSEU|nr:DJ-1/PfpI family protein [Lentzea fradiae]SDF42992.1 DJ-1/PfpI family protein [Lentzea fradiae]